MIGLRAGIAGRPAQRARFIPPPPGPDLEAATRDLLDWIHTDHRPQIDPVVAAAMAHYQFETLHPFHDGNGRLGRLLIVVHLLRSRTLTEPTLSVSPWFEARRQRYYDGLLGVSTSGEWDTWISLFAEGLAESARSTQKQMLDLFGVQHQLKEMLRASRLRADSAHVLVDLAVSELAFTARRAADHLGLSYARTNKLIGDLVELGVLRSWGDSGYSRTFVAPAVLRVLIGADL